MTGDLGVADRSAVEAWFVARGLPHFIDHYSASKDVFTRALPLLTLILVLELVGALNFEWTWWVNVVVAVTSFAALLAVWAVTNRLRHRPLFARAERVGPAELAVFVLVPAVLPLAAGGQWLTALNTFLGNCVLLGLIYLTTSYGLVPLTRWAGGRLWGQLGALFGLLVRALPLLLVFVVLLFLTPELWQVAASMNGPFLALAIGLFVGLGAIFVVSRIPNEVREIAQLPPEISPLTAGTPAAKLMAELQFVPSEADAPLSRRQWGNVGLVLLFTQGLQVIFVSLMIGAFLVVFGLIAVSPQTAAAWVGHDIHQIVGGTLWGRNVALTSELLQVAAFLATVAGFSFTLSLLTDRAYREEFLRDIVGELHQAFAVRAVYLSAVAKEKS